MLSSLSNSKGKMSPNLLLVTAMAVGRDPFPLEVWDQILKASGSIPFLKTCRLVSKSWNEISCSILRKLAAVPLNVQDKDDFKKFRQLFLDRHTLFSSDWPNPFRNCKFLEASFSNRGFLHLCRRRNLKITTLEIVHDKDFNAGAFESILERHYSSLVHLKIKGNFEAVPFETRTLQFGWRALRAVTLKDSCMVSINRCPHVRFLIKLSTTVNIKEMRLEGHLPNIARIFDESNKSCWDELRKLHLICETVPSNLTPEEIHTFMKWAIEIKFPSLTDLNVLATDDEKPEETSQTYTPYLFVLIRDSCQSLEKLKVPFLSISFLPSCPKLTYLCCALRDGDRIQDTSKRMFPYLTAVNYFIFWKEVPVYAEPKEGETNKYLRDVVVFWDVRTTDAALATLWPSLQVHFPKFRVLWLQSHISLRTLNVIRKRLPLLKELNIRSISSEDLLGSSFASDLAPKGWPSQSQYIEDSTLSEMTNLIHLGLGEFVMLSPDVIPLLGRLPKIKLLSFHWHDGLEGSDLWLNLRHIENVTIFYKEKEHKRVLEMLSKYMKNLKSKRFI